MHPDLFAHYLAEQWQHTAPLELIAVCFGVAEVLLAFRNSVLLYPAGIISTAIYTWLFIRPGTGLYADAILNVYYFAMSVYGWYHWRRRKHSHTELPVSRATSAERRIASGIFIAAFCFLLLFLKYATDSSVPLADAFVSATAWTGMWFLARRKIENWVVLNISNAAAIPLLLYKKMPLTALLTLFLFIVAVLGYFRWRRLLKTKAAPAA